MFRGAARRCWIACFLFSSHTVMIRSLIRPASRSRSVNACSLTLDVDTPNLDGLLLRTASQQGTIPWGQNGLPLDGSDRLAVEAELRLLDQAVDGVADLLTAESVFQIVRGNSAKAREQYELTVRGARTDYNDRHYQTEAAEELKSLR